jgi:hypothetical protein
VIKDNGTTPFRRITGTMNNTSEIWPKGKYKLKARVECDEDQPRTFSVYITAFIPTAPPGGIIPVGGLRIKKIENKFINDNKVQSKNFRYEDADDSNKSSGVLTNYPKYEHDYTVNKIGTDAGCVVVENKLCRYKLRRSLSNYPLATTQGSYVGYKHVIEDQETNGETRYTFEAYPDYNSGVFPYAPEENYEWRRGVLKNRKDYRKVNGVPSIVKEVIHNYSSSGSKNIYGIKVGSNFLQIFEGCGQPTGNPSGDYLKWSFYSTSTEMHNLTRTIERDYDINDIAKYIETTTDYTYSPKHYQLAETKTTVTRNNVGITKEILTSKKYPFDYTFTSVPTENTSLAIKKLQDLNIARAPIEELTVRQDRSSTNVVTNARVVGGSLITYKSYGPYPDQIYRLSINSPVALSTFGSGSSIVNNVFTKNALFQPLVLFDSYDSDGNIKKQRKADDMYYSYIWGYNNRYPIAEIKNCSSELDVACTSFEPESTGNWSYGATSNSPDANPVPTGKKCYSLSTGAIQKTLLAAGNVYILSYWKKSTASVTITGGNIVGNEETFVGINGWVMVKRKFTGASSISISGTGYIDELRLYPESSEMTTYTYDPLIGIRSITDNNGVSIYSDFDKLGRLEFLKDQKLNIMKYYQYNYKIQ